MHLNFKNIFISSIAIFLLVISCKNDSKKEEPLKFLLKPKFSLQQKFYYQVNYNYHFTTPITIDRFTVHHRSIMQYYRITVVDKIKQKYIASTNITQLQLKDFDKDSLLLAQYNSSFENMNIGYGKGMSSILQPWINYKDTIDLLSGITTASDNYASAPLYLLYPKHHVKQGDTFELNMSNMRGVATIQQMDVNYSVISFTAKNNKLQLTATYKIDNTNGIVVEGRQVFFISQDVKYQRVIVDYVLVK